MDECENGKGSCAKTGSSQNQKIEAWESEGQVSRALVTVILW